MSSTLVETRDVKPGYRVTSDGRVQSCVIGGRHPRLGDTWRDLKGTPQRRGHLTVFLGRRDQRYVHRMVLEAFVGPCPEGMECLHGDGNPGNNRLSNLRWGTPWENYQDSVRHGTAIFVRGGFSPRGEAHHVSKLSEPIVREVMQIRRETGKGAVGICKVMKIPDVFRGAVDGILRGQSWNHVTGLPPYQVRSNKRGRPPKSTLSEAA